MSKSLSQITQRNNMHFIIILFLVLTNCAKQEIIKPNDGIIEAPLEKVTGVTTERIRAIKKGQNLSIDDLYSIAVERTERIALKQEGVRQAEAVKDGVVAGLFPTLSFVSNKFTTYPAHHNPYDTYNPNYSGYRQVDPTIAALNPGYYSSGSSATVSPAVSGGNRLLLSIPIINGNPFANFKSAEALKLVRLHEARFES
ncbi:MAG: TolC family protein, partial [Leptospira sp.]|nr:TolC family protein [Leptospira sp.]